MCDGISCGFNFNFLKWQGSFNLKNAFPLFLTFQLICLRNYIFCPVEFTILILLLISLLCCSYVPLSPPISFKLVSKFRGLVILSFFDKCTADVIRCMSYSVLLRGSSCLVVSSSVSVRLIIEFRRNFPSTFYLIFLQPLKICISLKVAERWYFNS